MTNALSREKSSYLQKASRQPVRWLPWSQAAFDQARKEDKPVLLSIGAMWCHGCHAMDRENYEDPDIANFINDHFVPIKVDRDERPEVDRLYQDAVAALIGEGAWPLTAFLTPEGDVFSGGTYLPPDPRWGQRGFRDLLREVSETYRTTAPSVRASADRIRNTRRTEAKKVTAEPDSGLIETAVRGMIRDFDFIHGGFGESPRFPHPGALKVLMSEFFRSKDQNLEGLLRKSLDSMARGGIHDQLGGGFHRYAAGPDWSAPHFEKLLSDNAELLRLYTRASSLFQDPLYRETTEGILNWTQTTMCDKDGGFFNAQDADVGPDDDGGLYTWTLEELKEILTEKELQIVCSYYNISNPAGRNILHNDRSLEDIADEYKIQPSLVRGLLSAGRDKLFWSRKSRLQPEVDSTIYTGVNALMASACLEAGRTLQLQEPVNLAILTIERILQQAWTIHGFAHAMEPSPASPGLLEDQVYTGLALLDAFQDTGRQTFLDAARKTAEILISRYQDPRDGGFFDVAAGSAGPKTTSANKPLQDTPAPGANPAAAIFLLRLHSLTGESAFPQVAETTLKCFASQAAECGVFAGTYFFALQYYLEGAFEIFIVGDDQDPKAEGLSHAAWETYRPRKQVHRLRPEGTRPEPAVQGMIDFIRVKRKPMAFVCVHGGCAAPVEDPTDLRNLILTFNP